MKHVKSTTHRHMALVNTLLREATTPKVSADRLWVVYASYGRFNGWAIVNANGKMDAKRVMGDSDWLVNGKIDSVESFAEYAHGDPHVDLESDLAELLEENPGLTELHAWVEIEWGT